MQNSKISILFIIFTFLFLNPSILAAWQEQSKFFPLDIASEDRFGWSVSISGDYAIVGMPYDDDNGTSSGSAYIFKLDGTSWVQQVKIVPQDNSDGDHFGYHVEMKDNYAIIGAGYTDDNGTRSGSAYIYKKSIFKNDPNWYQQAKLLPSDGASYNYFGKSVSISAGYAICSASWNSSTNYKAGAAYIFKSDPNGTNWIQHQKLVPSDLQELSYFGEPVAMDGDHLVALRGNGDAYIFEINDSNWVQTEKIVGHYFNDVSVYGDLIVLGAYEDHDVNNGQYSGAAYVYRKSGSDWIQEARLVASDGAPDDYFGSNVHINGNNIFIHASGDDDMGTSSSSVYVFQNEDFAWKQIDKLIASDGAEYDYFGTDISVCNGYSLISSAFCNDHGENSGGVYFFKRICPDSDVTDDCYVDFEDFSTLAQEWLK